MTQQALDGTIYINVVVEQPERPTLHPKLTDVIQAGLALGVRVIDNPRVATTRICDPGGNILAQDTNLSERLDKYCNAARAIEARGMGFRQLTVLAEKFARRDNVSEPWYRSLARIRGVHEEREVERAFAEWCDADTVAAHVGYGVDLLCTEDLGKSAGGPSVFDAQNRKWLTDTFGVRIVSLTELAAMI